ncbi:DUF1294 domain-containing protein [Brevibacillus sp. SYP-B805]|nr:DUF1294 domain-containing protein [Brevibacillus sp. SYP-B805]
MWRHKRTRALVLLFCWSLLLAAWYAERTALAALGLLVINLYACGLAFVDKRAAQRNGPRIPEASLWLSALLGGAAGLLAGMLLFRHKTRHAAFRYGVPAVLCLHVLLLFLARL